ncbi:hypothetical protein ACLBOM_37470 [Escherichia coli]
MASAPQQSALPLDMPAHPGWKPPAPQNLHAGRNMPGTSLAFSPAHYNFDRQKRPEFSHT